ncbi:hypothetical protein SDC9_138069 [bioreactor metagenome]|uniref:Uncharacterized protein n=1 Tax=bioreactor metagenome TaxID=1076179 RepID=A0A645DNS7_9ZZZZ
MTILELIAAQCGVQGVDKKHAARIEKVSGITEEKDGNIIAAVKNFKENILPAIQEAENTGKKSIEEYEKKHGLKDGKPVETKIDEPEKIDDSDLRSIVQNLAKSVATLAETQKKSSTLEVVRAKLKGKIDDDFIDEYAGRVKLDADNIDAEVESAIKSFTELKQKFLNKEVESGNYIPANGGVTQKDFDDYVQRTKGGDSTYKGIEV